MNFIQYLLNQGTSTAETATTILLFPSAIFIFFFGLMLFAILCGWIVSYPLRAFKGNIPSPK